MKLLPAPRLRRAAAAALVLTATAALTGCSGASPSVVAYVGGEKITQTQLEQAVDGLSTTLQEGQTVSSEAVVNAMIQGELAEQIAAEQGIALTDADREAVLAQSELAPLTKVPEAREVVNDVADSQIVAQKLGADAFLAELAERDVTLNPRYGVLDPAQKTVVSGRTGSLSEPVEPAPAP
ncbi:SurA N-terminal domain-containing protein [Microlunatus capsulatus]|uniref:SurA N-terminal domain-containing protein n=1 Tax=Microlunatus capsulatus TaxID=99117 RepID=A0ABS4ZBM0_9ACTN|nr:SurA N-terminal domain-containing protein [Microlunatus capsulatus]MBP2418107.1 hypothetical protein [Microlunatus capsulatus]